MLIRINCLIGQTFSSSDRNREESKQKMTVKDIYTMPTPTVNDVMFALLSITARLLGYLRFELYCVVQCDG